MKDLFDMFTDDDYSRMKWDENDMLVPTDEIVDFDIDDLVEIIIKSYTNPRPKRIINISDGNPCNQINFYREACRISNSKMPKIYKK